MSPHKKRRRSTESCGESPVATLAPQSGGRCDSWNFSTAAAAAADGGGGAGAEEAEGHLASLSLSLFDAPCTACLQSSQFLLPVSPSSSALFSEISTALDESAISKSVVPTLFSRNGSLEKLISLFKFLIDSPMRKVDRLTD